MASEVIIVDRQGPSNRKVKVTDQREVLVKVNNSSTEPVNVTVVSNGTSTIINIPTTTSGTISNFNFASIHNNGSSNILINGEIVEPGIIINGWQGDFTYDSQSSKIFIITE
jgi:hypothetical protein